MMRTDQLIAKLADSWRPPGNARVRIAIAIAAGWLASLAGLFMVLGPPLREMEHTGIASFAVKLGYTVALASLSVMAAIAAGRPGSRLTRPLGLIAIPIVMLSFVTLLELGSAEAAARRGMLFGSSYQNCVMSVVLASLPVFIGLVWGYRILAPTRLPVAGFLVGLSAGAAGAVAFTLYCHETSAAFLFAAYTPAMLISALVGAIGGRLLLNW
jgi:hypothetical protein